MEPPLTPHGSEELFELVELCLFDLMADAVLSMYEGGEGGGRFL
jgi:hypothetical protein